MKEWKRYLTGMLLGAAVLTAAGCSRSTENAADNGMNSQETTEGGTAEDGRGIDEILFDTDGDGVYDHTDVDGDGLLEEIGRDADDVVDDIVNGATETGETLVDGVENAVDGDGTPTEEKAADPDGAAE